MSDPGSFETSAGGCGAASPVVVSAAQHDLWTLGDGSVRLLMVDNYDSFTYNLVQTLVLFDTTIEVVRNDHMSVDEILAREPDCIVLSPGPGRPENAGICVELLERKVPIPTLGVCLGHQAIGLAYGARVDSAVRLMHGKTSNMRIRGPLPGGHPMFDGVASGFEATRYHSLCVAESTLPEELVPLAWSGDGTLMAMAHATLPLWGMQFHPESILTSAGPRLLSNFVDLGRSFRTSRSQENS